MPLPFQVRLTFRLALSLMLPMLLGMLFAVPLCGQQLSLQGLRSQGGLGQFNGLKADAAGNLYTLLDGRDGVRLLKLDATGSQLLGQAHIGQQGDQGVALALDPAGNIYVAGTSLSTGSVSGTLGTTFPARADSKTNSFLARFSPSLNEQWLTFLGSGKMAVVAVDASATQVVVTGGIFAATLPVTSGGIQQMPLPNSGGGNGFVESFSAGTGTLQYATYLSGANGGTQPSGIALDGSGNAYVAGGTSATGFPTVHALVPILLTDSANSVSGFVTKLTPAGDGFLFSTFVPGNGLNSVAFDAATNSVLLSGSVASGLFPVTQVTMPLAAKLQYQSAVRMSADGSTVVSATALVPATSSVIAPGADGFAVAATSQNTGTVPLLPVGALQTQGNAFLLQADARGVVQRSARVGGLPVNNSGYASIPALLSGVVSGQDGSVTVAGGVAPTLSSSLLPTQRYDLTLAAAPNAALPSTVRDALPSPACNGSACAGGAALLSRMSVGVAPMLALSVDDLPNLVLRNTGATEATGLQINVSGFSYTTNCEGTLPAGSECALGLAGAGPGGITVASGNASAVSASLPANTVAASAIRVAPRELDFGIDSAASPARTRTFTVSNLGSTTQTFVSQLSGLAQAYTVRESASDCTPAGDGVSKTLAAGASCHIALAIAASADAMNDGGVEAHWQIGTQEVALTGYAQAAAVTVSATHIGFGRQYAGGLRVPRYLYLSNGSDVPQTHATVSLPPGSPFTLLDGCPGTLAPQSVCALALTYDAPSVPSSDAVTLTLDGSISVLVDGQTLPQPGVTGASVNPFLSVTPATVAFANPVIATTVSTETQVVTIQNTGVNGFPLTAAVAGDFSASDCPATLPGGASCVVTVRFTPSAAGSRQGLLSVAAGPSEPVYVSLSGQGTAFLPTNNGFIDFGEVPLQTPSVQWFKIARPFQSLTVASSIGSYGVVIVEDDGFGHGQPDRAAFRQTASGSCRNCYVGVQFLPADIGAQLGVVRFSSVAGGMSEALAVTGRGRALTGVLLTPVSQDFGSVPVGSTTAGIVFALTNATGSTLSTGQPAFTGDFSLSAATTGGAACGGFAHGWCKLPDWCAVRAIGDRHSRGKAFCPGRQRDCVGVAYRIRRRRSGRELSAGVAPVFERARHGEHAAEHHDREHGVAASHYWNADGQRPALQRDFYLLYAWRGCILCGDRYLHAYARAQCGPAHPSRNDGTRRRGADDQLHACPCRTVHRGERRYPDRAGRNGGHSLWLGRHRNRGRGTRAAREQSDWEIAGGRGGGTPAVSDCGLDLRRPGTVRELRPDRDLCSPDGRGRDRHRLCAGDTDRWQPNTGRPGLPGGLRFEREHDRRLRQSVAHRCARPWAGWLRAELQPDDHPDQPGRSHRQFRRHDPSHSLGAAVSEHDHLR